MTCLCENKANNKAWAADCEIISLDVDIMNRCWPNILISVVLFEMGINIEPYLGSYGLEPALLPSETGPVLLQ